MEAVESGTGFVPVAAVCTVLSTKNHFTMSMTDAAVPQDPPAEPVRPSAFEKLKGYLGLLVALVIVVLAFFPVGRERLYPMAAELTALDGTVLTQLSVLKKDSSMRYWMYASESLRECPPARAREGERRVVYPWRNCDEVDLTLVQLTRERVAEIEPFEPTLRALLNEYAPLLRDDIADDDPRKRVKNSASRNAELHLPIFTAVAKYLEAQRTPMAAGVYVAHGAVLLLAFAVVMLRRQVGAVLLWPLSVALGGAAAGAKAAKQLHEKV